MKRRSSGRASPPVTRKRARAAAAAAARAANPPTSTPPVVDVEEDEVIEVPVQNKADSDIQSAKLTWQKMLPLVNMVASRFDEECHTSAMTTENWLEVYVHVSTIFNLNSDKQLVKLTFYKELDNYVSTYLDKQFDRLMGLEGEDLLRAYVKRWYIVHRFVSFLTRVFHVMHFRWTPQFEHVPLSKMGSDNLAVTSVEKLFLVYWKAILRYRLPNLSDIIIDLIEDNRRGIPLDPKVIKDTLATFIIIGNLNVGDMVTDEKQKNVQRLKFYVNVFENPFLFRTAKYYDTVAKNYARSPDDDPVQHIAAIAKMLHAEEELVKLLLQDRSQVPVRRVLEKKLVGNHLDLYHSYARRLIAPKPNDYLFLMSLSTVISLLSRIEGGLNPVRVTFRDSIIQEGRDIIATKYPKNSISSYSSFSKFLPMIDALVELLDRRVDMLNQAFQNQNGFAMALDYAFRNIINRMIDTNSSSMPVILAHYVNHVVTGEILDDIPFSEERKMTKSRMVIETVEAEGSVIRRGKVGGTAKRPRSRVTHMDVVPSGEIIPPPRRRRRSERLLRKNASSVKGNSGTGVKVLLNLDLMDRESLPPALKDCNFTNSRRDTFLDSHLNRCIQLFAFVEDKDLFVETCENLLAKRLMDVYAPNLEGRFINKLQEHMGPQVTSKLSGMLADIAKSKVTRSQFEDWMRNEIETMNGHIQNTKLMKQARVTALNNLYWPKYTTDNLKIPRALKTIEESFERFYSPKNSKRQLTWLRHQSTVELLVKVGRKTYTVTMSVVQACVLLLFNDKKKLTLKAMAEAVGMDAAQLETHVAKLAKRRPNAFLRKRITRDADETDNENVLYGSDAEEIGECVEKSNENEEYELNDKFFSDVTDFSVEAGEKVKANPKLVATKREDIFDRPVQIDAAVVRVLKVKKRLTELELISYVVRRLGKLFMPTKKTIRKQLESLVEREIIWVDPDNANAYLYDI